jgi:predicted Zn-dependent protease
MKLCLVFITALFAFAQEIKPGPAFIVKISEEASKQIEQQSGIVKDSVLLNRLRPIARDIMKASDIRSFFDCRILNSEVVNAFALPAGPIYVTMGMVSFLDSLKTDETRSMIAGVIGHEIAHVAMRHAVAWARLNEFMNEQPSGIPSDVAQILEKGYSREQEFEADEYGILYAMRAGYDFEAIIRFYKRFRELYGETPPGDEKYDDHPRATERIAKLYEVRAQLERDFDQFNFGVAAMNEGRFGEAATYFKLFTTSFSNSASGWSNLGSAYLYEALASMEGPAVRFMVTYFNTPGQHLRGRPDELAYAEEAYKRAAEVDTGYNVVYFGNMGIIAALNADYDKSMEYTKRALQANEGQHFFYNNLGNALFLKNQYEDAVEAYKNAIAINSSWPLPVYNLAVLYETAGQKELAVDTWRSLLDVSGFSRDAVQHLALLDKKFKPDVKEIKAETGLGGISLGMTEDSVISRLGNPDDRIAVETMVIMPFSSVGMMVFLRQKTVSGILGESGFNGNTAMGITIGSTAEAVRAAYGLPDDIVSQKEGEQWVYTRYGLLLTVSSGKVNSLQVVKTADM